MHQIRVHLQYLGHPIMNDPIYNHPTAWGEGNGQKGTAIDTKKVLLTIFILIFTLSKILIFLK